ncbi:MAG: lyase family protein, partial [Candidatus Methanomethylophilaceae archaeon]
MDQKALWSGRFDGDLDDSTLGFTSSLDVDVRMAYYDIMGSLAHVKMLGATGILPSSDVSAIIKGLKDILKELEEGRLKLDDKLEDIHTNVEFRLTESIGPTGGRLHTGRSRNDQVATDFRMYLRDAVLGTLRSLENLQRALISKAEEHLDTVMPGFTHMQHAQPVTLAYHLMTHCFRLQRDSDRFLDAYKRLNVCPLGSAALAGT